MEWIHCILLLRKTKPLWSRNINMQKIFQGRLILDIRMLKSIISWYFNSIIVLSWSAERKYLCSRFKRHPFPFLISAINKKTYVINIFAFVQFDLMSSNLPSPKMLYLCLIFYLIVSLVRNFSFSRELWYGVGDRSSRSLIAFMSESISFICSNY